MHEQMPAPLRNARILFWKPSYGFEDDQSIAMPNLVHPAYHNPVSLGLGTIASHIDELDLRAFLTPDLFKAPVQWPHLRRL